MIKRFGLIGETLHYSLSPQIHEHLYKLLGVEAQYTLIEISKEDFSTGKNLETLRSLDGFNVTIPYKETIMPYLDAVDTIAQSIGAVNTVKVENNKWIGYNTDYYGFLEVLKPVKLKKPFRAIVLGTGGAAKMAKVALESLSCDEIVIVSRVPEKARLKFPHVRCIDYDEFNTANWPSDLLVNCTPRGHSPRGHLSRGHTTGSHEVLEAEPVITNLALSKQGYIFDLNYNPSLTPLLEQGSKVNVDGCNGFSMLVAQAVKAEEIWLDRELDVEKITNEIIIELNK